MIGGVVLLVLGISYDWSINIFKNRCFYFFSKWNKVTRPWGYFDTPTEFKVNSVDRSKIDSWVGYFVPLTTF